MGEELYIERENGRMGVWSMGWGRREKPETLRV
jgi:hypothetical protein